MQILTLHATIGLQSILKQIGQKMTFLTPGPTIGRSMHPRPILGLLWETLFFLNRHMLMQIFTLHATIGLQTKLEANWMKNGIFSPRWAHSWPSVGPSVATRRVTTSDQQEDSVGDLHTKFHNCSSSSFWDISKNGIFSPWWDHSQPLAGPSVATWRVAITQHPEDCEGNLHTKF